MGLDQTVGRLNWRVAMADTDAPSEDSWGGEGSRFRGDPTIVRSTHGIEAVRQVTCVSNDIAVHALEVDVLPGPAWAQSRRSRTRGCRFYWTRSAAVASNRD